MPYQSFGNIPGSSDSELKYTCMNLEKTNISNKVCIDIGCNEGFFCYKMAQLGAKEVVGIDKNKDTIVRATKRLEGEDCNIKFLNIDIMDYTPTIKYDIILISSALHYMDAFKVFPKIVSMMNPGGIFIYEGGVIMDSTANKWMVIKRSRDTVTHPTKNAFECLSNKYFAKTILIGKSALQKGDPIERYVYHCYL